MRTMILALAFTVISLGAIETKAEVRTINHNYSANYSSRMYAKRSIRTAKISILRAKRVIGNWGYSPFRADLAEAIRHQQYAIDLYMWGDFYEAARNSDYAGRVAEYILFEAYDNGYCSYNDYYSNNNSTWFWGTNNGWGFGFGQPNNGWNNNNGWSNNNSGNNNNGGYNNNGGFDNNGFGNGGFDDDYNKKDKTYNGPRKRGSTENVPNQNSNNNPRMNGAPSKPTFDQNANTSPRGQQPNMDGNRMAAPKNTSPQQGGGAERPKASETQKEEMKQAFEKIKMDKPDDSKMKLKSKSDDEVLKSSEKLDVDL